MPIDPGLGMTIKEIAHELGLPIDSDKVYRIINEEYELVCDGPPRRFALKTDSGQVSQAS